MSRTVPAAAAICACERCSTPGSPRHHADGAARVTEQKLCNALQDVGEREVGDGVDRTAARLRRRDKKSQREFGVVARGMNHCFAR